MNRHLQQMLRMMFLLHHREVQPLWTTTQVPISVTLLSNNIHFTACLLAVTSERPKLITPSPSSSRVLKVSGRKKTGRTQTPSLWSEWLRDKTGRTEKGLTEEQFQANQAAHKVVKVDVEVLAVAGHDDLMQRVVEREACQHARCDKRWPWSVGLWLFTWRNAFWATDFSHLQPRQPSSSQRRPCSHFDLRLCLCICSNVDVNRWGLYMLVSLSYYSYVCFWNGHKPGTYQECLNLCPQDPEFYQP